MARNVDVVVNHDAIAQLFMADGVAQVVGHTAREVAAVASALQDPHRLGADVTVEDTSSEALGIRGIDNRPASAVVFTGKGWHDERGDQIVAGTPNSGKSAIEHFAKG